MSDLIHKTALSALTGILILVSVSDIFGQGAAYTLTDPRDSRIYPIVKIGNQWWMAQNLDIGEMIPSTEEMTENDNIEKYCIENNSAYCDTFGGLYQWDELMKYTITESAQGICPDGWHIPSDEDWKILESALGMPQSSIDSAEEYRGTVEGGMLKQTGNIFWIEPNVGATNEVGFNLLPAGGRGPDGTISYDGSWTDFWTSTQYSQNDSFAHWRMIVNSSSKIYRSLTGYKPHGTSVRCVKNIPALYEMSTITDARDGQVYKIVRIGTQWWMAQNLNVGLMVTDDIPSIQNDQIEKYCYDNQSENCDIYGGLYQWDEMMDYQTSDTSNPGITKGICPDGWHLPTESEWNLLEAFIAESGNSGIEATVLKSTWGWNSGGNGTDIYGFEGLPGGKLNEPPGGFYPPGYYGFYWTATESSASYSYSKYLEYSHPQIYHTGDEKGNGYSVRCVMDSDVALSIDLLAPDTVCASQEFDITAQVNGGTGPYAINWTSDPPGIYPGEKIITVAPTINTKYILSVDDVESTARDSILVIVNPIPELDLTGPTQVCAGEEDSTEYSTPNNLNYQYSWFADNGEITSAPNISQIVVNWVSTAQTRSLNLVVSDNVTGCETQKQISVEILPTPSFNIVGPEIVCAGEKSNTYSTQNNTDYQFDWFTDNGQITTSADVDQIIVDWGITPGIKTLNLVVASKTSGCQAEEQISVQVFPLPSFNISGPTSLCAGEGVKAYSAAENVNYDYDWNTENGVITTAADKSQTEVNWGTIPGTKTLNLEITDITNNCHALRQVNVEVRPSPEKPEMVLKSQQYPIFICTDSGQIYQWYHDGIPIPNQTKQFYYARNATDRNGEISVEISSVNGCKNMSDPYVFSAKSSAYNEDSELNIVFIHPNPNDGLVTIEIFDDYTGLMDIEIINNLGQIVQRFQMTKPLEIYRSELDLRQLNGGIYFLIFKFNMNREIHRIFINRTY